jgi:hypothetical protein
MLTSHDIKVIPLFGKAEKLLLAAIAATAIALAVVGFIAF